MKLVIKKTSYPKWFWFGQSLYEKKLGFVWFWLAWEFTFQTKQQVQNCTDLMNPDARCDCGEDH